MILQLIFRHHLIFFHQMKVVEGCAYIMLTDSQAKEVICRNISQPHIQTILLGIALCN